MTGQNDYVRWFDDLGRQDVPSVGGKNASLGEMITALGGQGIRVPGGFATTARAYRAYIASNGIEGAIRSLVDEFHAGGRSLHAAGEAIRGLIRSGEFPGSVAKAIRTAYRELCQRYRSERVDVAVRSSATAEDLPEASFAGQLESFLNVCGEADLLHACRECYASLFTDRAIAYREQHGFDHMAVALSVGVQKMVRSDRAGAGVLFTLDTDTGFRDVVFINAAWGLGENVVQGSVNPDQYTVYKPFVGRVKDPMLAKRLGSKAQKMIYADEGERTTSNVPTSDAERSSFVLTDEEILQLAAWAVAIERHYGMPMDVEWAKDGDLEQVFIVQARPETVHSRRSTATLKSYHLDETGERLVTGLAIGQGVAAGRVCSIESARDIDRFEDGSVLVTGRTDPDWVPIMKRAAAIVTDMGGRTSHAAIVSRELGIPAVVGTGNATRTLRAGREVTVSCVEGDEGYVYDGRLDYRVEEIELGELPTTRARIMMNVASPQTAMRWWRLPCRGVGLARMEYLINNVIQVHPLALTRFDSLKDSDAKQRIRELTRSYESHTSYFVENLARGIATIAAAHRPEPVIVRMSDFKTNEYAELIGGRQFEPKEENPMLGWRGASRYYSPDYRDGFELECRAIRYVREEMGFRNVVVMIPFCRTPEEADRVLGVLAENGLERGKHDLQVYVMAEIPSNIIEAEAFAERFDGFSIGSNDLTQLVLGVGRDAEKLSHLFDESEESVKRLIHDLVDRAHRVGRPVGICGEAPSNDPEFAAFLVQIGIDSMSLSPDSVVRVIETVAAAEARLDASGGRPASNEVSRGP